MPGAVIIFVFVFDCASISVYLELGREEVPWQFSGGHVHDSISLPLKLLSKTLSVLTKLSMIKKTISINSLEKCEWFYEFFSTDWCVNLRELLPLCSLGLVLGDLSKNSLPCD